MEYYEEVIRVIFALVKAAVWAICTVVSFAAMVIYLFELLSGFSVGNALVFLFLVLLTIAVAAQFPKSI